jgi:expansin (peptidoglycan-binding protein)
MVIAGLPVGRIVIQWWYGEEPANSNLSLLTADGSSRWVAAVQDGTVLVTGR